MSPEAIIDSILRCCGETLTALNLFGLSIGQKSVIKLLTLLLRLQKIKILDCNFDHLLFQMLPPHVPELRELTLEAFRNGDRFGTFPKLEALSIGKFEDDAFKLFLKKNQQLKSIELRYDCDCLEVFDVLAECIPSIENLSILYESYALPSVATSCSMSALKKLVVKGKRNAVFLAAAVQIPIECLEIQECELDFVLIVSICELQKIEKLRLIDVSKIEQPLFLRMCNRLSNLTELAYFQFSIERIRIPM